MSDFKWEEFSFPIGLPCKPKGICRKIPMKKKVITETNELWEYYFLADGRMRWIYLGSILSSATLYVK